MATLRKRRGKWQVQIRHKGFPERSKTFLRKADALQWATETQIEIDRKGLAFDPRALELTVSDLMTRYRDTVVISHRGHKNETIVIDAFLRHEIASTQLSELNPAHFASYRDYRLKAVRPATINRELGLIQRAFEVARKEWAIPLVVNPVREITKPKADRPRDRRPTAVEWQRLLVAANKTRSPLLLPVIRFAVETGNLLLDGNHRAVALLLSGMPFEITLLSIEGPIEHTSLLDMRYWQLPRHDND